MVVINPVHSALDVGLVMVHDGGDYVVVVVTSCLLQVVRSDILRPVPDNQPQKRRKYVQPTFPSRIMSMDKIYNSSMTGW